MKKKQKRTEGNFVKYTTRNQALKRLQIKLPAFRRLCILKGIHPREPKKKVHGQNKTYYHVKDIKFLSIDPLLEKEREIRAYDRKVKKARAKWNEDLVERLKKNAPSYTIDRLVKERYPSFIDALRDMDDPLTMMHLFAVLPADNTHKIPHERVHNARRLSLEWQAYVSRTHALRKTFVSVKGVYYQAEVIGQKITWLVPHPLSQVLPNDVDFRVMLTFLEFYETLMGFVNFKLYHSLGLSYPPRLDPKLERAAAELSAIMANLAKRPEEAAPPAAADVEMTAAAAAAGGVGEEEEKEKEKEEGTSRNSEKLKDGEETRDQKVLLQAESAARLESLQNRFSAMKKEEEERNRKQKEEAKAMEQDKVESTPTEEEEEGIDDEETKACATLFKSFVFFLSREVARESLLFVIRAFGGKVSWEGEGAPFTESDESITHQIVDRPTQGHIFLTREYVQPQWIYDCANCRVLISMDSYRPGTTLPPHLSPFVDNEKEGYLPEYAETITKMKDAIANSDGKAGVLPLPGEEEDTEDGDRAVAAMRADESVAAAKEAELAKLEARFAEELAKEAAGVPYSESLSAKKTKRKKRKSSDGREAAAEDMMKVEGEQQEKEEESDEEEEDEEEEEKEEMEGKVGNETSRKAKITSGAAREEEDEAAMAQIMMPRKTRKLYEAMQMGLEAKSAGIDRLKKRREALAERLGKNKAGGEKQGGDSKPQKAGKKRGNAKR